MHDRTLAIEAAIAHENKPTLRYLTRLFAYVFSSAKVVCAIYLGLTILLSLLRPALVFMWGKYVDMANTYLPGGEVLPMILLIVAYYLIDFVAYMIGRYTVPMEEIERLDVVQQHRFEERLFSRLFRKLAHMPPEYYEIPKINDMIQRTFDFLSNSWDGMNGGVMRQSYYIIAKSVSVVSIALSLAIYSPMLCLVVILAPIPVLYTTYIGNKLRFKFVRDNAATKREADYFENLLLRPSAKEIKALHLFDFIYGKWQTHIEKYTKGERQTMLRGALLDTLGNLITGGASVAGTLMAIVMMARGEIGLGALGAAMALISSLIGDTSQLFQSISTFLSKKNEAAQFYELMDLPEQKQQDAAQDTALGAIQGIVAQDVRYRYPLTDQFVLDGVSLTIRPGEKVAFVGENGVGKTTFVKLLTGMLTPTSGHLQVNGQGYEAIAPDALHQQMSAVFQEPVHYTTFSVTDNVKIGDVSRDEAEIPAALAFAGFEGVDVDAMLGKDVGGTDLSGGQWQKLAIARGYFRKRGFIILDEPTSNLDPLAEAEVFQQYIDMAKDNTVVMVTHRISVATLADRVVVFAQGKVAEDGTHEELMARHGEYARLFETQAQWYDR